MSRLRTALLLSLLIAGGAAAPARAAVSVTREPIGYYVVTSAQLTATFPSTEVYSADVAGAVLRRNWADVNPAPGQYNWDYFDTMLAQLQAGGKQAQLTVFAGVTAPSWIYTLGAQQLSFTDSRFPGQTFIMPVPWDPVMLAQWNIFVTALGARYDGNPILTAVHMAGPTEFSAEMYIPQQAAQLPGFSTAVMTAAWTQTIAGYSAAFPSTPTVLELSNPLVASDGIAVAVAAVAAGALGDRATFQHDSLAAKTSSTYNIQQLVVQYAQQGVRVGFEMVSASSDARFGGSFSTAVALGDASAPRYLNIYSSDADGLTAPYVPARLQNPVNPLDVDASGAITPLDALIVINYLNSGGASFLPPPVAGAVVPFYYDVNGDGYSSPLDALIVINWLNTPQ